jgi:hypothetical protein
LLYTNKIIFLPPYSPDLNPIEIFWVNFKRMVQVDLENLKTLANAIDFAFMKVMGFAKTWLSKLTEKPMGKPSMVS